MPSAKSRKFRRASKALAIGAGLGLIVLATTVKAENLRVTQATDYWYHFDTTTVFEVRTYAVAGYGSDPMLWLYNDLGVLLVANDDWYGLQSHLSIELQPGWYRLRAGVCCGNPDAWWSGVQYDLSANLTAVIPTTVGSTTTTDVSTTTTEMSTTTTEPPTTTTEEPTTTVEETTSLPSTSTSTTVQVWPSITTTTSTVPPTSEPEIQSTTSSSLLESSTSSFPTSTLTPTTLPEILASTTLPETTLPTESTSLSTTSLAPSTTLELMGSSSTTSLVTVAPTSLAKTATTVTSLAPTTTTVPPNPPLRPVATTMMVDQTTTTTTVSWSVEEPIAALPENPTDEQVEAVITEIAENLDQLSGQQLDQLAKELSVAPPKVKEAFEEEVNIFGGGFDNYVPANQTVTVAQRRALVVVGAVLAATPVVMGARRK